MQRGRLSLPVEIQEQIIDHLALSRGSRRALRNCALVCRAWTPRSHNLFRTVVLAPVGVETMRQLAQVLYESPRLRSLVGEIRISMAHQPKEEQLTVRESCEVLPLVLSGVVPTLHSTLKVTAMNRNAVPLRLHRAFFTSLTQITSITTLRLYHVMFYSFGDFARIISTLTKLHSLGCDHVRWRSMGARRFPPSYHMACTISRLHWEGANTSSEELPVLAPGTDALLTNVCQSIEELCIDAHDLGSPSRSSQPPLSAFPMLHTLQVNWRCSREQAQKNTEATAALATARSSSLERFILKLEPDMVKLSSRLDDHVRALARTLDPRLNSPFFPALRLVTVHIGVISWSGDPGRWYSQLSELFPATFQRGLLHICGVRQNPSHRTLVLEDVEILSEGRMTLL
ncbi:hypothetical protein C8Q77DRAFT_1138762 [Trametes polyzona]|nr:hypothetical protein C8Q77DRAFT_1138762 [Trametes polyzona]